MKNLIRSLENNVHFGV